MFLSGVYKTYQLCGNEAYFSYMKDWIDSVFTEDGRIKNDYKHGDLDDIQRAEEAVIGQKVRVLDFSDDSSNVVVPGREARGGRRGTDGGIILRSSDSGSSQSGGIIVKQ